MTGGGTSPQPRRVQRVEGLRSIPIGYLVGIPAAIVILLALLIATCSGGDGSYRNLTVDKEEYRRLSATYESWGYSLFDESVELYTREAKNKGWDHFWLGSQTDLNKRITFTREGNKWKPRIGR